ncbi:MAG TPA: methyltransferase domain-containing protein [Thermoanaerobaculia bacterium]|nr:methyltransferase domain-containing protein [Thermoanaerobaculia bacterium]
MTAYLSTFAAGLGEPVRSALEERLPGVRVELELDGLIVYESGRDAAAVRDLPFFNNSFTVLKTFSGLGAERGKEVLNEMLAAALADRDLPAQLAKQAKGTFRLVTAWSNELTAVDRGLLEKVEARVAASGRLRPHRGRPDHEIWLSYRSEGHGFLLLRLTRHTAYERVLAKGELRPELAWILCHLSEPREGELMLDPFCGSGAIPLTRATQFPRGLVLASDLDGAQVEKLKARVKEEDLKKRIVVRQGDARDLSRYADGSIHKIVTDPPWGHFQELAGGAEAFYQEVLAELVRVLAPGGLLVMLAPRADFLAPLLAALPLEVVERCEVLVSGRKVAVYKVRKEPGTAGTSGTTGTSL